MPRMLAMGHLDELNEPEGITMNKATRVIKGLGEVSIRVSNLDTMHKFYEQVVGLEVLRREDNFVFFRIAEGYAGHPQVLNLFAATDRWLLESKSEQLNPEQTTLHHFALNISLEDYAGEKKRLESLGIKVHAVVHEWLHVRSLYFSDPEGNLIELVCYDPSVG